MSRIKVRQYVSATLCVVALLTPSITWAFGGVGHFTIVDPSRDMNWYLKEIKKYLVLTEKKLASLESRYRKQIQSLQKIRNAEANSSAQIRAVTSAQSITQNNASDNRFKPSTSELLCSTIHSAKSVLDRVLKFPQSTCEQKQDAKQSEAKSLELRFIKGLHQDAYFYQYLVNKPEVQQDKDKDVIKAMAKAVQDYDTTLNQYTLIDEESYDELHAVNELIFDWGVRLPSPKYIEKQLTARNIVKRIGPAFLSNTYQSFIERYLKDRTQFRGQYAKDAPIIDGVDGEKYKALIEEIGHAETSEDSIRLLALTKAKKLQTQYKRLDVSLRNQATAALKLKSSLQK